jgi:hypothetical protein
MRVTRRTRDKAERATHKANLLHQKIAHERAQPTAAEREAHLQQREAAAELDRENQIRARIGLPPTRKRDDE